MYNIEYFKHIDWFKIVRRNNSAFFDSFLRYGPPQINKELNFDNSMKHHLVLGRDTYASKQEFEKLKERMISVANKDDNFISKYLQKVDKDCTEYTKFINYLSKNYNKKNLSESYIRYKNSTLKIISHLWPPLGIEDYLIKKIEENLSKYIDAKKDFNTFNAALQSLISSDEMTAIQKKRQAVLLLALEIKNNKINKNSQKIKKIFKKYEYIEDHGINFDGPSLKVFIEQIIEISRNEKPEIELDKMISDLQKIKKDKKEIIKKYKLNKNIINLSNCAAKLPHTRLTRLEVIGEGAYKLKNNLFADIAKKLGIKDILNLYNWEIEPSLKIGKVIKEAANRGKLHYFAIVNDYTKEFNKEEGKKLQSLIEKENKDNIKEIKGNIACMGMAKGKVKIILSPEEFHNFEEGDILVTSMTMPDYLPIMKKASAIITDEGGISCHAAIVSRELKKPCIIGTKIATKVLKNGDLVKIDANRGLIKKY